MFPSVVGSLRGGLGQLLRADVLYFSLDFLLSASSVLLSRILSSLFHGQRVRARVQAMSSDCGKG